MSGFLTVVIGDRGSGRTETILKLLHKEAELKGKPALLVVDPVSQIQFIDTQIIHDGLSVQTKGLVQLRSLTSREWAAVGLDLRTPDIPRLGEDRWLYENVTHMTSFAMCSVSVAAFERSRGWNLPA